MTTPPDEPQAQEGRIGSNGLDEQTIFRSLHAAYPDALLVVDGRGRVVLANPAASTLLGYSAEELLGLSVDALVPDAVRSRHAAYREAYGHRPKPRPMGTQMELAAKRKDGSEVMVEIALSPVQDHGLPFVVASIRDIGAYPRVKQALQRARYSEFLANLGRLAVDSRDPKVVLDQVPAMATEALHAELAQVYLLQPNRLEFRVASGLGLPEVEAPGALIPNRPGTLPGLVLAEGRTVLVQDYRQETRVAVPASYLAAGLRQAIAAPLIDRGRVIGAVMVSNGGQVRFGDDELRFVESMSSLLTTSLQRAASEDALNHAQRLESVGQLTGGIAHDFNNLLTVIQGNLQVLEELPALSDNDHGQQLLAAAMRASRRGAELTSKLLAFSRRQVLQPDALDVAALLRSLADMLRRTLDQRIRIEVDCQDSPPVLADPGQLESALLNIAINARDAMPEGGILRFSARPCGVLPAEARRELEDPSMAHERLVEIAITDSGAGMPEAVKERAFEPFFTTKAAGRGTGLGLSTVYGFVKQSKGVITIDSAPGQGTTVTLRLPRPWATDTVTEAQSAPSQAVPAGLKVLLVEDDAEVRGVVRHFLDTLKCQVTVCTSAEQALLLLTPEARFDLLLTDVALGAGMRGTELALHAQARFPALAVLLMSGFSAELLDADRDSPPSWELLPKPYTREQLAQAIARLMA